MNLPATAIAIDGPAGAGKSTVSKLLAAKLGFELLDTGAMYRTFAWLLLESKQIDKSLWPQIVNNHQIETSWAQGKFRVMVDGMDISQNIRSAEVTNFVSEVSAVPDLRSLAVLAQRKYVEDAIADGRGVVIEGRDIGTTVLPDARVKFFLTADATARANRRALETGRTAAVVLEEVNARDTADSERAISPLRQAEDAILVDSTFMDAETVVDFMIQAAEQRFK